VGEVDGDGADEADGMLFAGYSCILLLEKHQYGSLVLP
jgi:hypothetical protein